MKDARSIILSLYADYLGFFWRFQEKEIGIGSLIKILSNFNVNTAAVRITVSRMCRGGYLTSRRNGRKSYYSLSERGRQIVARGAERIFNVKRTKWDGKWSLVTYCIPEKKRAARNKLRQMLRVIGYVPLSDSSWLCPVNFFTEVEEVVSELKIKSYVLLCESTLQGFTDPKELVERCWDLNEIRSRYEQFINEFQSLMEEHKVRLQNGNYLEPSAYFINTFYLVRKYRELPFIDPGLPVEIVGKDWPRERADEVFHEYHRLLFEKAQEYFLSVMKDY